jgi:hypothetical protein
MAITGNIDEKIKQAKAAGYSDTQIQTYLKSQGVTVPKVSIAQKVMNGAAKVTDALGLRHASDVIADDINDITHPSLMEATGALKRSLLDNARAGAELGLATAGGEFSGAAAAAARTGVKIAGKAVASTAGRGLEATGQKIQQSVIRPAIADIKDGFKIENVAKYDVGGDLPQTIAKTQVKLNAFGKELASKLTGTDAKIDLNETLAETARRLADDKAGSFGDNGALDRVLEHIDGEIKHMGGHEHDLVSATNIKRAAGTKGAWAYNRPEADANAIERAYTTFYGVLKEQIEKAAPEGVKEINKKLSDLITIQNAALRRLPVEQRNNVFSLTDSIGFLSSVFDPRALLLVGATKAAKSGRVGNALVKAGRAMQGKK